MALDEDTVRHAAARVGLELKAWPGGGYVLYDEQIGAHVHELEWGRAPWPTLDGPWDCLEAKTWVDDRGRDRDLHQLAAKLGWAVGRRRDGGWMLKPENATVDDEPVLRGPYCRIRDAVQEVADLIAGLAQEAERQSAAGQPDGS